MEQMEVFRREETRRLIEWIVVNESDWVSICAALTEENALVEKEFIQVIEVLKNNGFYQLIVALLYSNNQVIKSAVEHSLLTDINQNWSKDLMDRIIESILKNIK